MKFIIEIIRYAVSLMLLKSKKTTNNEKKPQTWKMDFGR